MELYLVVSLIGFLLRTKSTSRSYRSRYTVKVTTKLSPSHINQFSPVIILFLLISISRRVLDTAPDNNMWN